MNVNEWVIRPLLSNASVIGLFFIPMITMRLFAEEKRTGTIELLATSPMRDMEIILGKWLAAIMLYACMLAIHGAQFRVPVQVRQAGLEAAAHGLSWAAAARRRPARDRHISSPRLTKNQIIAGAVTFAVCLLLWVLEWVSGYETATWARYSLTCQSSRTSSPSPRA